MITTMELNNNNGEYTDTTHNEKAKQGPAACSRTGECCRRLVVDNVLEWNPEELTWSNKKIVEEWQVTAKKAEPSKIFTCEHYDPATHSCLIQDEKPEVCVSSLSKEYFERQITSANLFSTDCGWLKGAPEEIVNLVRNNMHLIGEGENYYTEEQLLEYRKEEEEHTYSIKDGYWVKQPKGTCKIEDGQVFSCDTIIIEEQ